MNTQQNETTPEQATPAQTTPRKRATSKKGASKHDQIMAYVAKRLTANASIENADLFAQAKVKFPSLRKMTPIQFHATFPLQIKRKAGSKQGRRKASTATRAARTNTANGRTPTRRGQKQIQMQSLLLEFAQAARKAQDVEAFFTEIGTYTDKALSL